MLCFGILIIVGICIAWYVSETDLSGCLLWTLGTYVFWSGGIGFIAVFSLCVQQPLFFVVSAIIGTIVSLWVFNLLSGGTPVLRIFVSVFAGFFLPSILVGFVYQLYLIASQLFGWH